MPRDIQGSRLAELLASCEGSSRRILLRANNAVAILERENAQLRETLAAQANRIHFLELRLQAISEQSLT